MTAALVGNSSAERAEWEARDLELFRQVLDAVAPQGVPALTLREVEVARLDMIDGFDSAEVAEELGIRPSTARAHFASFVTKLGGFEIWPRREILRAYWRLF